MDGISITTLEQLPEGLTKGLNYLFKEIGEIKASLNSSLSAPTQSSETVYRTRKETAALLKISMPTLNEYTKAGIISASRIGRRVLYTEESIQLALKQIKTSIK